MQSKNQNGACAHHSMHGIRHLQGKHKETLIILFHNVPLIIRNQTFQRGKPIAKRHPDTHHKLSASHHHHVIIILSLSHATRYPKEDNCQHDMGHQQPHHPILPSSLGAAFNNFIRRRRRRKKTLDTQSLRQRRATRHALHFSFTERAQRTSKTTRHHTKAPHMHAVFEMPPALYSCTTTRLKKMQANCTLGAHILSDDDETITIRTNYICCQR